MQASWQLQCRNAGKKLGLSCKTTQANWQLAVQEGREKQGLKLVSRQFRRHVWHRGLPAAGPHGVWALRRGPLTGPVQDARQLQEDTGKLSLGVYRFLELVSRQFRRQRLAPWAAGCGPDPSFSAMVFGPCGGVL